MQRVTLAGLIDTRVSHWAHTQNTALWKYILLVKFEIKSLHLLITLHIIECITATLDGCSWGKDAEVTSAAGTSLNSAHPSS